MNEVALPELPKGWVWTRVENCIDILDNQRIPINADEREKRISGKLLSQLHPYYGATGQVGWIDDYLFNEELVLLGEDGAPFLEPTKNKAYIIKGKSWINNHAHVLRAIPNITMNQYLCNYLNIFDYHDYVTGTTRLKLNQSPMRKIPIPLPPLPEQQRIVAKIEELFTRLDAGVESLKKIKAQLKRYRQSVLKHAFEGKLTEEWRETHKGELEPASVLLQRIKEERKKDAHGKYKELPSLDTSELPELPERWVWTRVGEVGEVETGTTPRKNKEEYYGNDYPFFKPTDLNAGYYVRESEDGLSRKGIEKARLLPAKSTLVTCIGATIGKTGFIRREGASNQQINAIIPKSDVLPEFIYFVCISPRFQKSITDNASATTLPILNKTRFEILALPFPSRSEQYQIVSEIERRLSVADEVEKVLEQSLKQAERMRQSILKKAFEGRLVPQDPTDESAERLLERIREENKKREEEKKNRKMYNKKITDSHFENTNKNVLYELLKLSKEKLTPERLLELSELDVKDFYLMLREEMRNGRIIERRLNNSKIILEVRK